MAGEGLLQLVANGIQDIHLTSDPQITFWKSVYKRYTNFARELIVQTFSGQVGFGRQMQAVVSRNGDLINQVYFAFELPAIEADVNNGSTEVYWTNCIGHAIIQEIEVQIGGQTIDKQYGEWMAIWHELCCAHVEFSELTGRRYTVKQLVQDSQSRRQFYTPLRFWFCMAPGLALPLIALQFHEVKIQVWTRPLSQLFVSLGNPEAVPLLKGTNNRLGSQDLLNAELYVQYVYLDGPERARFASSSHEYLISQLQFINQTFGAGGGNGLCNVRVNLTFNHPVTELQWVVQQECHRMNNNWFNYEGLDGQDPIVSVDLRLNNHSRFEPREAKYFRTIEPLEHHTNVPDKHIYTYAFGLDSEKQQPSGTTNFSRIDNACLDLQLQAGLGPICVSVYAINKNVLRVLAGMAGVAYSN